MRTELGLMGEKSVGSGLVISGSLPSGPGRNSAERADSLLLSTKEKPEKAVLLLFSKLTHTGSAPC